MFIELPKAPSTQYCSRCEGKNVDLKLFQSPLYLSPHLKPVFVYLYSEINLEDINEAADTNAREN